ncbi:hypothetical protein D6C98_08553 [Aureobasidium pullulans]|nr:hypothetical protein D6D25_08967 [Aureobasidium pullulans]THW15161.1 hypothetical protein D6D23_09089 [Aureobasidium pullulans]THY43491.1 hypothetical protein D6C98_08553 [Aureobasidium pullulans]
MKVTATTSAAIIALTSSTLVNAKAWTMHIYNDGGDWQGVPIVAWNGQFVAALGEFDTTATCQPEVWNCTGKNTTMISGLDEAGTANDLWMAITQAGGQKVYWHDAPKGTNIRGYSYPLSYTAASYSDDASVIKTDVVGQKFGVLNVTTGGFSPDDDTLRLATMDSTGRFSTTFALCSANVADQDYYRLTVGQGKGCTPIDIELRESDVDAPQFYDCRGCQFRNNRDDDPVCERPFCFETTSMFT